VNDFTHDNPAQTIDWRPAPDSFLQRVMEVRPREDWPIESVEVRDSHRGPGAWASYLALRFAQQTLGRMPRAVREFVAGTFARLAEVIDRRHSDAALDFVGTALPELSAKERRQLVRRSWVHLVDMSLTAPFLAKSLLGKKVGDVFDVRMTEEARALIEAQTPAILMGCHVGNWEIAGLLHTTMGLDPVYAVAKAPRNDPLSRHMQRTREQQGGRLLPQLEAMKSVPAAIRGGGSVMFMLDHRPRRKPVFAPFFGRPAACGRSAGVLLRRVGAPIVFYSCCRSNGARPYELQYGPVLQAEDLAHLNPVEIATRLNQVYEVLIRRHPEQYFWLHDRFKRMPKTWEALERAHAQGHEYPFRAWKAE
jgi:KDO2-lipid IV(A) lauroyltransferase